MSLIRKITSFQAFATQVGTLSLPYFRSSEKWKARGLLAAIVALNLAAVYMLVLINDWNRLSYDALQNKDQSVFWTGAQARVERRAHGCAACDHPGATALVVG